MSFRLPISLSNRACASHFTNTAGSRAGPFAGAMYCSSPNSSLSTCGYRNNKATSDWDPGRHGDIPLRPGVNEEPSDLPFSHLARMALSVVQHVVPNPAGVRLLGAPAHLAQPDLVPNLVQQLTFRHNAATLRKENRPLTLFAPATYRTATRGSIHALSGTRKGSYVEEVRIRRSYTAPDPLANPI